MTTIANLGIKVSSEGVEKTEKALDKLSTTSTKSEKAIERMIESIKKQNMILNSGKAAYTEYAMTALGASKAEQKLATDIIKATESIKASRKTASDQLKKNIAETKVGNKERLASIKEVEKAEKKRSGEIGKIITALDKEEKALKMSKHEQSEYNLALLGASKAEKDAAKQITDRIKVIKAAKKAEDESIRAIKKSKIAKDALIKSEQKRRDSVKTTIMKLQDEVAVLGKSKSELLGYKLALAGATSAERKQALALQRTVDEFKESNKTIKKHDSALMGLAKRISVVALAYGAIRSIHEFGRSLVETAVMADSYKYSLQAVSDTNEEAAESYQYLKDESERLGLSITGQADSFTGFAASAKAAKLTVDETRSSYTGLNEAMTAMHRTPEQMAAGLMALEQMLGKGVVQSEELKRQLANALPGAVPMFADALGVSVKELKNLMKNGLVPAKEAVMIFTDYMTYKFASKAEDASNSVQASFNKMYNSLYELREAIVTAIGDEGTGIISDFTAEIRNMTKALSAPENQKAMAGMARSLSEIARAAIAAGRGLAWIVDNTMTPLTVMQQGLDLIDAGILDSQTFFKSTQEERMKLIKESSDVQDQYVGKVFESSEAEKKITAEIIEANKAKFAAIVADEERNKRLDRTKKALERLIESTRKQAKEAGKSNAEIMQMRALELGATKLQAQSIYDEVTATEAKKKAIKDLSDRMKEIQSDEDKRQSTIDKVIQKLKDEIATYKQGKEATAEYTLKQNQANDAETKLAESLGKTLDNLKAKTAAQKEYNSVMETVSPDKIEMNREKAILAVNAAMASGAIIDTEYANSLKLVNEYYDEIAETEADKKLKDITSELEGLTSIDASTFGNTLADGLNNAVTSMNNLMKVYDKNEKAQERIKDLQKDLATGKGSPEQRAKSLSEIDKAETAMIKNQISGYRELFGTTSQLFDENTRERKALHNAEMAFAAVEIAMNTTKAVSLGVVAVVNAMSAGDPYTAVARGLAVAATVAAALAQIGGSFSMGGGGGGSVATKAETASGTVLGSSAAASESLQNSQEFLEDMHAEDYTQLKGIHSEVKDLNSNITGLVSSLYRGGIGGFAAGDMGVNLDFIQSSLSEFNDEIFSGIQDSMDAVFMSFIDPLTVAVTGFAGEIGNWVVSGMFGGGQSAEIQEQGITTAGLVKIGDLISGAMIDTMKYVDIKIETDGGWFHSDKTSYRTETEDLGTSIDNLFTQIFSGLGETFVGIAELIGRDIRTVQDFAFEIGDIDLKNLETSEEINEALSAAISGISDEAATTLFGDLIGQYQTVGEGMLETAIRVASEKVVVLETIDKLGDAFVDADVPALAIEFSQSMIDIAGDLESFMESTSTYYDKFFTDEEKQADIGEMLSRSFAGFEMDLPETRNLYRNVVDGLDLTTEAGKRAYVSMLEMSDSADEYYSYLENLEDKRLGMTIQIMELEGNAAGALAMSRQAELNAMDESLRPMQERIWSLEEEDRQNTIKIGLEEQLLTLNEDTVALRLLAIDGMNAENVALYDRIQAIKTSTEAEVKAKKEISEAETKTTRVKNDYLSALQSELSILEGNLNTARSNYVSGLESEVSILEGNLESAKSTYLDMLNEEAAAQHALADSIGSAIGSIKDYRASLFAPISAVTDITALSARRESLAGKVSGGDTGSVSELISVSDQYLDVAKETSRTSIDYTREVALTNTLMFNVQESLGEQLTEAEEQAKAFDELISGVDGTKDIALTISEAQEKYNTAKSILDRNWYNEEIKKIDHDKTIDELRTDYYEAKKEFDNNWYADEIEALGGISLSIYEFKDLYSSALEEERAAREELESEDPDITIQALDTGGINVGGTVGDEISYRPPSQTTQNNDTMGGLSNKEVIEELKMLREELAKANFAIAKNTQDAAKTLKKFDIDGMPAVRDEVAA